MSIILSLSNYAIPVIIGYIVLYGLIKRVDIFTVFIAGAKDGFKMVVELLPTLVGLLVAIGIFRSSGALDLFCGIFSPLTKLLHIPETIIPIALVKMFSSSAATGMVLDVFRTFGPDSLSGNIVSIMMSSTETIFYTLSVYSLSVGVTKTRWTLAGALLASIVGIACSVLLAMYM